MFAGDSVGVSAVAASASRSSAATPRARVRDPVRRPEVLDIDANVEEHCPLSERPGEDGEDLGPDLRGRRRGRPSALPEWGPGAAGEKIKSQKPIKEMKKGNN
eukprot:14403511-Heterocapsa_arctica.AAC.1